MGYKSVWKIKGEPSSKAKYDILSDSEEVSWEKVLK